MIVDDETNIKIKKINDEEYNYKKPSSHLPLGGF
jgi:hypothetical protein